MLESNCLPLFILPVSWSRSVEHIAQLWQRNRSKLASFRLTSIATLFAKSQNCILEPPYRGIRDNINALSESFDPKKLCSRVISIEYQLCS